MKFGKIDRIRSPGCVGDTILVGTWRDPIQYYCRECKTKFSLNDACSCSIEYLSCPICEASQK